jgi:hypothetical protein
MALGLWRTLRRRRSFRAEVAEELNFLIEKYGAEAARIVRERLAGGDLRPGQRKVLEAAAKKLKA